MSEAHVLYATANGTGFVKLVGELRYPSAPTLAAFLDRLFRRGGLTQVVVDLTEATSIDSTHLGLVAKVANYALEHLERPAILVTDHEDITEILRSVGFDRVFTLFDQGVPPPGELEEVPQMPSDDRALAATLLDAHRTLIGLNEDNRQRFKDVVELLERKDN
jgi:anti-anti-sigma factor